MKRTHVYVSGIVQGVFFRHYAKERAFELGIAGWVRNLPDGRVEAVFEGEDKAVGEMLAFCRKGSPGADVTGVEIKEEKWTGEFKEFVVKR